jgi:hypothetical protein
MPIRPLALGDLPGVADMWNGAIRASAITFAAEEKTGLGLAAWLVAGPPRLAAARGRRVWPQRLAAASGRSVWPQRLAAASGRRGGAMARCWDSPPRARFAPAPAMRGCGSAAFSSPARPGPAQPGSARGQGVGAALIDALAGAGQGLAV